MLNVGWKLSIQSATNFSRVTTNADQSDYYIDSDLHLTQQTALYRIYRARKSMWKQLETCNRELIEYSKRYELWMCGLLINFEFSSFQSCIIHQWILIEWSLLTFSLQKGWNNEDTFNVISFRGNVNKFYEGA